MHSWIFLALTALLFQEAGIEARIVEYLRANTEPGRAFVVSDLFNDVFTEPEEQAVLNRLYNTFFKIPMFLVQFQEGTGEPPTLQQISEQFAFQAPGQADVILEVMEADPRVPTFFERDPASGEITRINVDPIRSHPQFGQAIERTIAGWEGRPMPGFATEAFDGAPVTSAVVEGVPHMVYVWFSNCPPCVQTAPLLVDLYAEYADSGFEIVAANADRVLQLPYDDAMRAEYLERVGIRFRTVHLTEEMLNAYGGVTVFPTMFFVNREGTVARHFVNFQERDVLEDAIRMVIE